MNGSFGSLDAFFDGLSFIPPDHISPVLCLPFPYLAYAARHFKTGVCGAQDCSEHVSGPYTGDVSAAMLADVGCKYVLIGHCERARYDTEESIRHKAERAIEQGLCPIICVGEHDQSTFVEDLIAQCTNRIPRGNICVAYEPRWAIGTGTPAPFAHVKESVARIRSFIDDGVPVFYGGSTDTSTVDELIGTTGIQGVLIGRTSLSPKSWESVLLAVADA